MQLNTLCLFHLLLALSLLFTFTSALPYRSRLDDVTMVPATEVAARDEMPSTGRLQARSFDADADDSIAAPPHTHTHLQRHSLPTPVADDESGHDLAGRDPLPTMENSLRGKTKVYSGNYWRRRI